jgi:hypothetical protein
MIEQTNHNQFKTILLKHSNNGDYLEAIKEWNLVYIEVEENHCICGKQILKNCNIKNKSNGNDLIVGSTCVKKFLGIETEHMFKELKNKMSYHYSYIEELHGKNKISDWEATFLVSLINFKKLSVKQKEWFKKIDKKIKSGKSYYKY